MAAVLRYFTWDAAPGKQAEMMKLMREAVPLWERHGAKVRIFNNLLSGADATTVSFIAEYQNMAAFAAASESLVADPENQAFQAKVNAAMVGKLVYGSLSTEVPSR